MGGGIRGVCWASLEGARGYLGFGLGANAQTCIVGLGVEDPRVQEMAALIRNVKYITRGVEGFEGLGFCYASHAVAGIFLTCRVRGAR